jgi:hypothetical protein
MIIAVVVRMLGFVIVRGLLGLVGLGPAPDAKGSIENNYKSSDFMV